MSPSGSAAGIIHTGPRAGLEMGTCTSGTCPLSYPLYGPAWSGLLAATSGIVAERLGAAFLVRQMGTWRRTSAGWKWVKMGTCTGGEAGDTYRFERSGTCPHRGPLRGLFTPVHAPASRWGHVPPVRVPFRIRLMVRHGADSWQRPAELWRNDSVPHFWYGRWGHGGGQAPDEDG
jgi:hypothetical protein